MSSMSAFAVSQTSSNTSLPERNSLSVSTLFGHKYSYTTKYTCTDVAIYRLNIQLETRPELNIQVSKVCCVSNNLGENILIFDIP